MFFPSYIPGCMRGGTWLLLFAIVYLEPSTVQSINLRTFLNLSEQTMWGPGVWINHPIFTVVMNWPVYFIRFMLVFLNKVLPGTEWAGVGAKGCNSPHRSLSMTWSDWPDRGNKASLVAQTVKNLPANAVDLGSISGFRRSPGGGHDNPLQDFCLENPMDRGAWRATVHGVALLKWLSSR